MEHLHSKSIAELAHLALLVIPHHELYILETNTRLDVDKVITCLFSADTETSNRARRLLESSLIVIANKIEIEKQNKNLKYPKKNLEEDQD